VIPGKDPESDKPDRKAMGDLGRDAKNAALKLDDVQRGTTDANTGCLNALAFASDAIRAVSVLAHAREGRGIGPTAHLAATVAEMAGATATGAHRFESAIEEQAETASQDLRRGEIHEALDSLFNTLLTLIALAGTGSRGPGHTTLQALTETLAGQAAFLGYQAPRAPAEAAARVAAEVVCPDGATARRLPGCTESDAGRAELIGHIRDNLINAGEGYGQACDDAKETLTKEIQVDAAFVEKFMDVFIVFVVVMSAGALGAEAAAIDGAGAAAGGAATGASSAGMLTEAGITEGSEAEMTAALKATSGWAATDAVGAAAKAATHERLGPEAFGAAFHKAMEKVGSEVIGASEHTANGDPRAATVAFIGALKDQVHTALDAFSDTQLHHLDDDQLGKLSASLEGARDTFRARGAAFIKEYEQHVAVIGEGFGDRDKATYTSCAWVSPRMGGAPRLAVVERSKTDDRIHSRDGGIDLKHRSPVRFVEWVKPGLEQMTLARWQGFSAQADQGDDRMPEAIEMVTIDDFENPPEDGEKWERRQMDPVEEDGSAPRRAYSHEDPVRRPQ
jgi:hypothetical protein